MGSRTLTEQALQDPRSVFQTPEAVVQASEIPLEHKRSILKRWRDLLGSPSPIQGSPPGDPGLVVRLTRALAFLDTETGGHNVTHDQGFYTSIGDIGKAPEKSAG